MNQAERLFHEYEVKGLNDDGDMSFVMEPNTDAKQLLHDFSELYLEKYIPIDEDAEEEVEFTVDTLKWMSGVQGDILWIGWGNWSWEDIRGEERLADRVGVEVPAASLQDVLDGMMG